MVPRSDKDEVVHLVVAVVSDNARRQMPAVVMRTMKVTSTGVVSAASKPYTGYFTCTCHPDYYTISLHWVTSPQSLRLDF